jgi:uncharacterized membrane-anchored protein YitT (DUF2179 family)
MKVILDNIIVICIAGFMIGISFNLILRIKTLSGVTNSIINDTLKRDGKWSVTRLTMFTAWMTVLWSYVYDIVKTGFNYQAFCIMVGVALGVKVTDAWSKKLNPESALPPKN